MSPSPLAPNRSYGRLPALALLAGLAVARFSAGQTIQGPGEDLDEKALVRVYITMESPSAKEAITSEGKRLDGYQPKILQVLPATGIVIDDDGHVLAFLGYRWVDVNSRDPHIEILADRGQSRLGKMIGIDQSVGVAVVRPQSGRLKKTPLCTDCRIHDGSTVVAPVFSSPGISQFEAVQVLSFVGEEGSGGGAEWVVRVNRVAGIGEPILDTRYRVLGFVANQRPSRDDPTGIRTVVYPMSQLLSSAKKILRAGGDIRSGWLGVYLADSSSEQGEPVIVKSVESESPAQRVGLAPEDRLLRWNGREIHGVRRFIRMVQDSMIGSKIALDVLRQGKAMTLYPVIQARKYRSATGRVMFNFSDDFPEQARWNMPPSGPFSQYRIGINAVPLSAELAEGLQMPSRKGLLILNVEPSSPLSQAGVMTGDILLSADESQVNSLDDLRAHLQSRASDSRIVLKLLRKGAERNATLQLRK